MEKTLHRDLYIEGEWFARERENIFFGEWTCIGRDEDWPEMGDYQAISIAGESLLAIRGDDGKLRAFFNVCRHRGCQLVDSADPEKQKGRMQSNIRCPYHSWTYRFDGSLHFTPHLDVEKEKYHLHRVPLDTWGGFVFANISSKDGSLAEQLGPIPQRVRRYPLADLETAKSIDYEVAANWKVILENYNECYHCAGVHPELCKIVPEFRKNGGAGLDWESGIPQKEGTDTFTMSGTANRPSFPGLNQAEKTKHFGELIYPNLMLSLSRDHAAAFILWPAGPEKTRIECRFLFHPEAIVQPDFDPSDAADFWHITNLQDWGICERVQRGMHSRPFESGYYAPMEDLSLDIRHYVSSRLGITVD
ncbi:MAG: aromatic ring-hydroxylating dioxygenase subunit alpha [Gammaproteobacteria bacterium]|nr:aromatic ring-hydroxylating dioxygenase subunit alpha [Gammaproteobacteria bacterium]